MKAIRRNPEDVLPKVVVFSLGVYRALLVAYPLRFRQRYGVEMAQVFRASCWAAYQQSGRRGVTRLWLPMLWDWAWTAMSERLTSIFRRNDMNATESFDHQLGDAVWMLVNGLRAAYSLKQVLWAVAQETPEPIASAFRQLSNDLEAGLPLDEACEKLKKAIPSAHLAEVLRVIQQQRQDWETAALLAKLSEEIIAQAGSDPALYEAMRVQARELGATLPERAHT
jgi:hypothetical protein